MFSLEHVSIEFHAAAHGKMKGRPRKSINFEIFRIWNFKAEAIQLKYNRSGFLLLLTIFLQNELLIKFSTNLTHRMTSTWLINLWTFHHDIFRFDAFILEISHEIMSILRIFADTTQHTKDFIPSDKIENSKGIKLEQMNKSFPYILQMFKDFNNNVRE